MRWSVGALGSSVHFAVVVGAGEVGDDGDCKGKGHLRLKAAAPLSSTRQPCLPASVLQQCALRFCLPLHLASHTFGGLYFFAVAHLATSFRGVRHVVAKVGNGIRSQNII